VSTTSSSSSEFSSLSHKSGTRDDSAITGTARVVSANGRPHSAIITSASGQNFGHPALSSPVKPSPDRYHRPNNRRAESASASQQTPAQTSLAASMPNVMQFYGQSTQQPSIPTVSTQNFNVQMPPLSRAPAGTLPGVAADSMVLNRQGTQDQAKRYRRRSIHTIDAGDYGSLSAGLLQQGSRQVSSANGRIDTHPLRSSPVLAVRPGSSHGRNGSTESVNSTRSGHHSRPSSVCISFKIFTAFLRSCIPASLQFIPHQLDRFGDHIR